MTNELSIGLAQASNATLDGLVHEIGIVWAKKHSQRTIYDSLLHTVNHVSKLGEQVRRGEYQGVINELGNTVMWFLTFVGKLQQPVEQRLKTGREELVFYTPITLTDIVWNKYPYTCPACFQRLTKENKQGDAWKRRCDCLLTG